MLANKYLEARKDKLKLLIRFFSFHGCENLNPNFLIFLNVRIRFSRRCALVIHTTSQPTTIPKVVNVFKHIKARILEIKLSSSGTAEATGIPTASVHLNGIMHQQWIAHARYLFIFLFLCVKLNLQTEVVSTRTGRALYYAFERPEVLRCALPLSCRMYSYRRTGYSLCEDLHILTATFCTCA